MHRKKKWIFEETDERVKQINLLKPSGFFTYHQV